MSICIYMCKAPTIVCYSKYASETYCYYRLPREKQRNRRGPGQGCHYCYTAVFYLKYTVQQHPKPCTCRITQDGKRENSTLISPNATENRLHAPLLQGRRHLGPVGSLVHLAHASGCSFLHASLVGVSSVGVAHGARALICGISQQSK